MTARVVERRIVTVLFADLVGFTSLSERLDAEDVSLIQDAYFDAVRDTVERHGGMLEKFVGDAAMAVFGAPRVRDDDASFDLDHSGPSWLAGVETVVGTWLRAGENDGTQEALDRMRARLEVGRATGLARGVEALLRARLLLGRDEAQGAAAKANSALAVIRAPWWRSKAIRVLEQAGGASADLVEEGRTIETRLGIPIEPAVP